jgi:hypothetical protein
MFQLDRTRLRHLPHEIGRLQSLSILNVRFQRVSVCLDWFDPGSPSGVGKRARVCPTRAWQPISTPKARRTTSCYDHSRLTNFLHLQLQSNQLQWLPLELDRLPPTTAIMVS